MTIGFFKGLYQNINIWRTNIIFPANALGMPSIYYTENNWHERAAFQRLAFGRLIAGNDVVATILISVFLRSLFSSSLLPLPFLIEGVLGSKNLFSESWPERPKT